MEKFKSRKFWLAVITAVLVILNDGLDLNIPKDAIMTVAAIVISWILGESFVDGVKR
jgi:uncharacterized membrane protein